MEHTFNFNDTDCLIISDALSYLIEDEERHILDRESARVIKHKIYAKVKKDKENNNG